MGRRQECTDGYRHRRSKPDHHADRKLLKVSRHPHVSAARVVPSRGADSRAETGQSAIFRLRGTGNRAGHFWGPRGAPGGFSRGGRCVLASDTREVPGTRRAVAYSRSRRRRQTVTRPREGVERRRSASRKFDADSLEALTSAVKRVERLDRQACRREVEQRFSAARTTTNYERVCRQPKEGCAA